MTTSAEDFLKIQDAEPKRETLNGMSFFVQVLSASERDYAYVVTDRQERRARLIECGILKEDKTRMFTLDQAKALLEKRSNIPEQLASLVIQANQANDEPDEGDEENE